MSRPVTMNDLFGDPEGCESTDDKTAKLASKAAGFERKGGRLLGLSIELALRHCEPTPQGCILPPQRRYRPGAVNTAGRAGAGRHCGNGCLGAESACGW